MAKASCTLVGMFVRFITLGVYFWRVDHFPPAIGPICFHIVGSINQVCPGVIVRRDSDDVVYAYTLTS